LAFAPLGGWVAVTNSIFFDRIILLLSLAVIFWVAGFDIIYALQDLEFDRKYGLHSIGAHFGKNFALRLSALNHAIFFVLVLFSTVMWSKIAVVGAVVIGLLLLYEHLAVRRGDIDTAFFKVNAIISSILLLTFLLTT
jgi:4-hydroxybenzoate polyprenyltransferase